jgi:hypothetical protein
MSEQMQHLTTNGEVGLMNISRVLGRYKWLLLTVPAICMVVALVVVTQMRPVWEASAFIQVGQVGQQLLEPIPSAVARLNSQIYSQKLFGQLGVTRSSSIALPEALLYKSSFKAKQIRDTNLIEIKLRAYSSELAEKLVLLTSDRLRMQHDKAMMASVSSMNEQLAALEKNIQSEKSSMKELEQRLFAGKLNDTGAALYSVIYQQNENGIREMEKAKLALQDMLSPNQTFSTGLVGQIDVSDQPVSPRKGLVVFLAALMGLLGTVFVAFLHNSFRTSEY